MFIPVTERFWLTVLVGYATILLIWAIFGIDKVEHKISIFALIGAIITTITSVVTVSIAHKRTKEREIDLLITKEKQKAFEHFYNFYFDLLKNIRCAKQSLVLLAGCKSRSGGGSGRSLVRANHPPVSVVVKEDVALSKQLCL
jgi:hypothetical protein